MDRKPLTPKQRERMQRFAEVEQHHFDVQARTLLRTPLTIDEIREMYEGNPAYFLGLQQALAKVIIEDALNDLDGNWRPAPMLALATLFGVELDEMEE